MTSPGRRPSSDSARISSGGGEPAVVNAMDTDDRPTTLYTSTVDGMLHAFRLEDDPATATEDVRADIVRSLGLEDPSVVVTEGAFQITSVSSPNVARAVASRRRGWPTGTATTPLGKA